MLVNGALGLFFNPNGDNHRISANIPRLLEVTRMLL